ncbi:MAG: divalent-cation tolerance protein CutA [Chloroflexi bacterium]|nr:divalent-cation tolerance protein CutA [Chloroflexota bacterium]
MAETPYAVILVTVGSDEEGHKIANKLLVERKAACVSILPGVSSLFWWQGKLDSAQEHMLVIKTKTANLPEIISLIKQHHSYQVPEIIALPVIGGNPDYLKWIDAEVKLVQ